MSSFPKQKKRICPRILEGDCPFGTERLNCYHAKLHIDQEEKCDDPGRSGTSDDLRHCGSCLFYNKLSEKHKLKLMLMEL